MLEQTCYSCQFSLILQKVPWKLTYLSMFWWTRNWNTAQVRKVVPYYVECYYADCIARLLYNISLIARRKYRQRWYWANFIELLNKNVYAYQNEVTSQITMPHVVSETGILLTPISVLNKQVYEIFPVGSVPIYFMLGHAMQTLEGKLIIWDSLTWNCLLVTF